MEPTVFTDKENNIETSHNFSRANSHRPRTKRKKFSQKSCKPLNNQSIIEPNNFYCETRLSLENSSFDKVKLLFHNKSPSFTHLGMRKNSCFSHQSKNSDSSIPLNNVYMAQNQKNSLSKEIKESYQSKKLKKNSHLSLNLTPTKPSLPNNLFRNEKQIKTSFGVSKSLNSSIIAEKKNLKLATKSDKKKLKKKHNQNLKIEIIKETDSDLNTFYKKSSTIRKTVNSSLMTYSKPQILSFHEALNDYHQIEFSSLTKPKNI